MSYLECIKKAKMNFPWLDQMLCLRKGKKAKSPVRCKNREWIRLKCGVSDFLSLKKVNALELLMLNILEPWVIEMFILGIVFG